MKKTELNGYVYDFSVDYDIAVDDILDIYKYLMKKKWYKTMFGFILKMFPVATGSIGLNINALKCDSMSNHGCKVRPEMINIVIIDLYFILTLFL